MRCVPFADCWRKPMGKKKKKASRIAPEEQAAFDRRTEEARARIAEREAIDRAEAEAERKSA
jgi:hypothetical protein